MINMESIQASLRRWLQSNENFKEQYEKLTKEVLNNPRIMEFLKDHDEITDDKINKNISKLYEYHTQSIQCDKCTCFDDCINVVQGYSPLLTFENNDIHIAYEKCSSRLNWEQGREESRLIESLYMPKEILEASIDHLDFAPGRGEAIKKMTEFLDEVADQPEVLPSQGLFFSGPFGVGKTYFLGAIANRLKQYNISSTMIYMPEFLRVIKDSIKDDSINEKVNYFKEADVLMLDDIGAETQSAWFRDEILGSILQYRMMEQLPVFFTSNYTMDQLEHQLATTTRGDVEKVKAGRIMERIRQVSEEVIITGSNRRN